MGFIGNNGAGKTTIIKLIMNMVQRSSGEIKIFGKDNILDEESVKQDIGIVFDHSCYVEEWSLKEVERALKPFYTNWDSNAYYRNLDRFELSQKKRVRELSTGMRMKLMIAVALSHDAKLLIMDEPTSGLDPVAREELIDILSDFVLSGERSVFISTHNTSDIQMIADYITIVNEGRIIYTGTKDDLLEKYCIIKGGVDEITNELKKTVIGYREYSTGFEGLIQTDKIKSFSTKLTVEPANLDEIMIFVRQRCKDE
jgi:ABC-2 type transport system ATP-binding protein